MTAAGCPSRYGVSTEASPDVRRAPRLTTAIRRVSLVRTQGELLGEPPVVTEGTKSLDPPLHVLAHKPAEGRIVLVERVDDGLGNLDGVAIRHVLPPARECPGGSLTIVRLVRSVGGQLDRSREWRSVSGGHHTRLNIPSTQSSTRASH